MECTPKDSILEFHQDTLGVVRKINGFDKGKIKEAVEILDEWVKRQDHFVKKDFSEHYLETILISSKGIMERAKTRLDKTCTVKTLLPEYFGDFDLRKDFKEFDGIISYAVAPKLTKDHNRTIIIRNCGQKFQSTLVLQFVRILINILEYLKAHDYSDGVILILDVAEVSLIELAKKVHPTELRKVTAIVIEAYGVRLKGLHIISASRIINGLVWIIKQVISAKLVERLHVHKSLETLHKCVPKDVLPSEYGGKERSLDTLHEEWINVLSTEENRMYFKEMSEACTNELLRMKDELIVEPIAVD